jgi:ferritin
MDGKAEKTFFEAKENERMTHARALIKLIRPAEDDIKQENVRDATIFFDEFRRKLSN